MSDIPAYVTTAEFGAATQMPIRKARRVLRGAGILEEHPGLGLVAEASKIRTKFPGFYQKLYEHFVLGGIGTEE